MADAMHQPIAESADEEAYRERWRGPWRAAGNPGPDAAQDRRWLWGGVPTERTDDMTDEQKCDFREAIRDKSPVETGPEVLATALSNIGTLSPRLRKVYDDSAALLRAQKAAIDAAAAAERERMNQHAVTLANTERLVERERCAKLADEYATWGGSNFAAWFNKLAAAIRQAGEKT